jgi:Domain of unknown function (DUF397)
MTADQSLELFVAPFSYLPDDIDPHSLKWQISSDSGGDQSSCVQTSRFNKDGVDYVAVRNSNDDPDTAVVTVFPLQYWRHFIRDIKAGMHDPRP